MQETKPRLILKRYRSILIASMIVEVVTFIVSLTDSIIAGQRCGHVYRGPALFSDGKECACQKAALGGMHAHF